VGHCQVGVLPDLNPGVDIGLTPSFSQEKLMEMQCELLISNISDPKTITRVKEIIGHISDGSSSYSAGALKLGLKKAFELKKQKRQPLGVLLQCGYGSCSWYNTPVPYSSAGSHIYGYCQACINCGYGGRYLLCVGCGCTRTGAYTSCTGCGRKFV